MKNVLSIFEGRINDIFAHGGAGSAPITFKKLAKKTIREMENETFVIDGVDTAPALYTVLVSADDDRTMRPFYANITAEVSSLVEAQAKKRGYTFVGQPLVRFMIDPSLKPGKYAVFAENVDPLTLARLREEENAFLGIEPAQQQPQQPEPASQANDGSEEDGFTIIPEDSIPIEEDVPAAPQGSSEPSLEEVAVPQEPLSEGVAARAQDGKASSDPAPQEQQPVAKEGDQESSQQPEPAPAAPAEAASEDQAPQPAEPPRHAQAPKAEPVPSCTLTDQQTGKVYTITSERTLIGREQAPGGIVLRDPNVSRRHAELTYDGREWHIHDLNSTNGTLVNDIDVEECSLRDGDVLTIGLLNLVFRER